MIRYLTVFRNIRLVICVKKVKIGPTDSHFPYSCRNCPPWEGYASSNPFTIVIDDRLCRNFSEILGIITRHLLALACNNLRKISITIKKADGYHIHVHV